MTSYVPDTQPYAWPYDGRIDGACLALVLAGWDDGWSTRAVADLDAVDRAAQLADAVLAVGGLVVTVAHGHAAALSAGSGPTTASVVAAVGIDGFHGSPLDAVLRQAGRTHLLVAGHGIEGPVHSTIRSANDRGYECLLVTDACTALTPDLAPASAKTVTMSGGIFGAIGTAAAVLAALAASPATGRPDPDPDPSTHVPGEQP